MRTGSDVGKVNLSEKFDPFNEYWSPEIVGDLTYSSMKLAELKGDCESHKHRNEDELFLVTRERLTIKLLNRSVVLGASSSSLQGCVKRKPVASREGHVVLIELESNLKTSGLRDERTVAKPDHL